MRLFIGFLLAASIASPVWAAKDPAPQLSVKQIERGLATKPSDDCREDPATGEFSGNCPRGANFRGFSLAAPEGGNPPSNNPSGKKPKAARGRQPQPYQAQAAKPQHIDLLISFKNGSTELTPQARSNARVFAKAMRGQALSNTRVAIEGHTNSVGSRASNQTLSDARAKAVVDFLAGEGLSRDRLEPHGYGFDRPLNGHGAAAPQNRRVEARRLD